MEKLRIFFIYREYSGRLPPWANQALYRSAVKAERLIYFFRVQPAVANQFACEQQDRDFVAVTSPSRGFQIDVHYVAGHIARRGHAGQIAEHFLAKAAPRA